MPTTKAQQRATAKYVAKNLEEVRFRVKKGKKEAIANHAKSKGESTQSYIKRLIGTDMGDTDL
ncbi:MAG: hypothetical protein FWC32_05110 [Firmicutes bacterium]|nr:hypothetical protein [Bacillota bacterium]